MTAKLLYTVKQFLGYNRLLHIGDNNLLLLYEVIDGLVYLVADGGDEIHGAAGVLPVSENVLNAAVRPQIRIGRTCIACGSADGIVISRRRENLFSFKVTGNLRWTTPRKAKVEYLSYHSAAGSSISHFSLSSCDFLWPYGTAEDTRFPCSDLLFQTARIFLLVSARHITH